MKKILLIELSPDQPKSNFLKRCWQGHWQLAGTMPNQVEIWVKRLPWQKQGWLKLKKERAQKIITKLLKKAAKRGFLLAGVSLFLQDFVVAPPPLTLVDGSKLALKEAINELAQKTKGLQGRQLVLVGLNGGQHEAYCIETLQKAGANLIFTGPRAAKLAKELYEQKGLAAATLPLAKALKIADGVLYMAKEPHVDVGEQTINSKWVITWPKEERCIKVEANWQKKDFWPQGTLPISLAAALLLAKDMPGFLLSKT